MKIIKGSALIFVAVCVKMVTALPFPLLGEKPIIDTTYVNIDGNLTPIIQETKDLSDFFKMLANMRDKKSLSIVGKDNQYIYLLVSDMENSKLISEFEEQLPQDAQLTREKRSLFMKLSEGLSLLGPTAIRSLAIPVSLFNYLGYLPIRLPGVPYHIDTGSPDKAVYDIVNRFYH